MTNLTLGAAIKARRQELGLTRQKLAAQVGTSTATLIRLECRDQPCRFKTLVAVSRALDLSLDEIAARL